MAERVIVRQDAEFRTEFLALPEDGKPGGEAEPVANLHELTPYGMLLVGLASCTAIVLHTYAQNHGLALRSVELRLAYNRVFQEDCQNCEEIDRYTERIEEEILLAGDLSSQEREKLFLISKQCPIHKMVESGIEVNSGLVEE